MAKYGIEATNMGDPDLKAAGFIRSPTEDRSSLTKEASKLPMLELGLKVAGQIPDAIAGYEIARYEKEQEAVVEDYVSRRPEALAQEQLNLGATKGAIDSIWEKAGSVEELEALVNPIEKDFRDRLAKFQRAKEQGVMTPEAFKERILATTREAANRAPGLYNEFLQHSQKVLGLSGIAAIVEKDTQAAKAQQDEFSKLKNDIIDLAKKHDVPLYLAGDGLPDYGRIKAEVDKVQIQKGAVEAYENKNKLVTEADKDQANQFMQGQGINLVTGLINQELARGISLMNQGGDVQGSLTQMRLGLNTAYQTFVAKVGPIMDNPKVKEALAFFQKQQEFVEGVISKATTKEDAIRLSNNATQMMKNKQFMEVSKYVNPEQLQITTQLLNTVGGARILERNPDLMDNMVTTFSDLLSGVSGSPRIDYKATNANGKNVVSGGINALAKETITDPSVMKHLEKAISTISSDVQNLEKFPTVDSKYEFYGKLIREMGDPTVNKAFTRMNPEVVGKAAGLLDDYMVLTTNSMHKEMLNWEKKGVAVTLDVLPDGRILFKTTNPAATQDLNSRYTRRINDSLSALSNLMGMDTKSTAVQQFYPQYLPAWADDKDINSPTPKTKLERSDFKIDPEVQKERDKTRLRVLQLEIDDYTKRLETEKNPTTRKILEENIQFVQKELSTVNK